MDPLSITASAITLAGALAKSLEQLRALQTASQDLLILINEISDFRIVLGEVERTILERRGYQHLPQTTLESMCTLLDRAKAKLLLLDKIVNDDLIRARLPSMEPKVARLGWLRQKPRIKELKESLKEIRLSLTALWGAASLADLSHIHIRLDEFAILQQNQFNELSEQGKRLQYIADQPNPSRSDGSSNEVFGESDQKVLSSTQTTEHAEVERPESSHHKAVIQLLPSNKLPKLMEGNRPKTYSTVRIRASQYRRSPCDEWCSCRCHQWKYLRSPQFADVILGTLFIGYSAVPIRRQRCNERNCRKQSICTLKVTYHFPHWLLGRMISFAASLTSMKGPQITLSMPRVVNGSADIFAFAVQGDIDGIKSLFSQGVASPYDVACTNGRTALHYAVNYDHAELSQFLLDTGADPNIQDKTLNSTVSIALDRIFGRMAERPTIDAFLCMFDNEDDLEARMFPALHKIILGLSSINLQQQLELSTSTIDDKDSNGRTALSWSATRGDAEAVKTLLSYGANPNECSHRGETSLHWAARSITKRSGEIMEALLKSGAKVNQMDCWKRTALIYASCDQEDPAFLRPLIDAGANLNMRDCHDRTSLGYAAKRGRARVLEFLLSYGADASIPDTWGYTPLFEGVQQNHHQVLQILLQCNQGSDSRVIGRNSIAHLVSKYGDVKTMRLLTNENVMGLDIHERNDDGFTPQDLFLERNHLTGELEEAFQSYIGLVDTRFRRDSENPDRLLLGNCIDQSDSESVDEFSDALEYQDAQLRLGDMEDNGSGAEKIGENHALMVG